MYISRTLDSCARRNCCVATNVVGRGVRSFLYSRLGSVIYHGALLYTRGLMKAATSKGFPSPAAILQRGWCSKHAGRVASFRCPMSSPVLVCFRLQTPVEGVAVGGGRTFVEGWDILIVLIYLHRVYFQTVRTGTLPRRHLARACEAWSHRRLPLSEPPTPIPPAYARCLFLF